MIEYTINKTLKEHNMSRKNHFADKRIATFNSLNTEPKEWSHAPVKRFLPFFHVTKTSGKQTEKWIPEYAIPDGYKNPYLKTDVEISGWKKCQLCDTDIVDYGIITHDHSRQYLVVGTECYEKYEDDSTKDLKLHLLTENKKEFFTKLMSAEKEKIKNLVTAYIEEKSKQNKHSDLNYNFYSTVIRDRWYNWSKVKFNNFIVKYATELWEVGYREPEEKLSLKVVHKFFEDVALIKFKTEMFNLCRYTIAKNLGIEVGNKPEGRTRSRYWGWNSFHQMDVVSKKNQSYSFSDYTFNSFKKLKGLCIDNHKRILSEDFDIETLVNVDAWELDPKKFEKDGSQIRNY